ncbi:XRE family transcriptional regulator [Pseudomonas aeruginosa]|nr:XRE family transcriptional regulator [Pseudomonas aeruginosa]
MTVDRIGERLRRYRRAAKKTLHQVASESGLTASFLSQAERNLTGVSISSLANIAKSLNIPLNALFDQPAQPQPDSHEGERVRYTIEGQPLAYERLSSSFPGNLINAVKMNMPVGYQSELISHEGAEFSYVLSGQIFDATKTHCLANVGSDVAEVLTITTMGLFDDHPTP